MKISDNTSVSMPIRNMVAIVVGVVMGVWGYLEKTIVRVDEMMHNGVNIQRMMKDIDRLRNDVEDLKNKVRENGNSYSTSNVSK
jgi:hypothetical protein